MLSKSYNPSGILLQFVQYQKIRKDNRISVSKYRNISIPTLYLDYIKKLSLYLFYTDENSGVTYGNEISKHAPTLHLQNRYGPPQTTRSDICESLFELLPISSEKELLSTSIGYVILTLKPLPYRYFYIGCFPNYSPPKANNFALFTTSLLSC